MEKHKSPSEKHLPEEGGAQPASDLLAAMYAHAPMIVVVMTTDGQVLHCNAAATRSTGYTESELVGRNFWSTLFPGRLFAQVPRFISTTHPGQIMGKDASMLMRTRDGKERVATWTHMLHEDADGHKTLVCFGTDLTDRLLDADLADKPVEEKREGGVDHASSEIDGEVVTPLFVSPPALPSDSSAAIQQMHEFLTEIDARMATLRMASSQEDLADLTTIATALRDGSQLDFAARAEKLCTTASCSEMDEARELVQKIVNMCNPVPPTV